MKWLLVHMDTTDALNIAFFLLLIATMFILSPWITTWWIYVLLDAGVIGAVFMLARFASTRSHFWRLLHGFYMMICIPIAFSQMYWIVPVVHPVDYDRALIAIDRFLFFGADPTHVLFSFAHPVVTEILQLAYASFYFLPLILVVDLYRKQRMAAFRVVFLTIILGFYLSYFGYVAVPAIGPRFTLHDFTATDTELPGVFATQFLRDYTNTGESIPPGTEDPARKVQRDVFPSGHTQMTLLTIFLAFRYRARTRWPLGIVGSLLVIATVYMRYHYVVDLIGGALFAILTFHLMKLLDVRWRQLRHHFFPQ